MVLLGDEPSTLRVFELQVDLETRFRLDTGTTTGAWMEVKGPSIIRDTKISHCDVEVHLDWDEERKALVDPNTREPVVIHETHDPQWVSIPPIKVSSSVGPRDRHPLHVPRLFPSVCALLLLQVLSLAATRTPLPLPPRPYQDEDAIREADPIRAISLILTRENGVTRHSRHK